MAGITTAKNRIRRKSLTQAMLRSMLHFDRRSGRWKWRTRHNGVKPDLSAGTQRQDGYIEIKINDVSYKAHVLACLYVNGAWPDSQIDHKDLVRSNNAWSNLREASPSQNKANGRARSDNACGLKGVYRSAVKKYRKPWVASIRVDGRLHHIGHFATAMEAHAAYLAEAKRYFGRFARSH